MLQNLLSYTYKGTKKKISYNETLRFIDTFFFLKLKYTLFHTFFIWNCIEQYFVQIFLDEKTWLVDIMPIAASWTLFSWLQLAWKL